MADAFGPPGSVRPGFWKTRVFDASGKRVKLATRRRIRASLGPERRNRFDAVSKASRKFEFHPIVFPVGIVCFVLGLMLTISVDFMFQGLVRFVGKVIGYGLTGGVGGLIGSYCYLPSLQRGLVRGAIDVGVCPSCLYDLRSVSMHEDGLLVCPECGGAWRVGGEA